MYNGPTVNLVSGCLVACYGLTCEIYRDRTWQHLQDTVHSRYYHSSATTEDAVLLIGGRDSDGTTEWIPVNGSAAQPGPFTVQHGERHCTMQISDEAIVVTGGYHTYEYVPEYQLTGGTETNLTSLAQPRYQHACGVYRDDQSNQVRIGFAVASTVVCSIEILYV